MKRKLRTVSVSGAVVLLAVLFVACGPVFRVDRLDIRLAENLSGTFVLTIQEAQPALSSNTADMITSTFLSELETIFAKCNFKTSQTRDRGFLVITTDFANPSELARASSCEIMPGLKLENVINLNISSHNESLGETRYEIQLSLARDLFCEVQVTMPGQITTVYPKLAAGVQITQVAVGPGSMSWQMPCPGKGVGENHYSSDVDLSKAFVGSATSTALARTKVFVEPSDTLPISLNIDSVRASGLSDWAPPALTLTGFALAGVIAALVIRARHKSRTARNIAPVMNHSQIRLYENLVAYFSMSDLQELCFELSIDDENLPGITKADKARELVLYCERHNRMGELKAKCRTQRPHVDW
ncbi:MAG: hypothetical protein M1434_02670 [Chloroflexi bacterium]|nr:hypothetical protein [Chloroflexota bacterium]MCL5273633.1 hypothetical protein [Chloroflexota bacterium]